MPFPLFSVIHEFAVLGTTFFLLALATLWYSPLLLGKVWAKAAGGTPAVFDEEAAGFGLQLGLTFVAYLLEVGLIAWLLAYAPTVGVVPSVFATVLSIFAIVVTAPPVLYEARSWQYFVVHTGFMVVFIVVAVLSLTYWPW
jgi:hypothetical protein